MYQMGDKVPAYDKVSTMFSPDGRLYQVEYASKIVEQGTTGLGLVFADGVMFAADKSIHSKLLIPKSIEKLFKVDEHIGFVSAGLVGDARRLVSIARKQAQENKMYYDESIQVQTLAKEIASIKQSLTQYGGMRPFGVSLIVGGVDVSGPRLFETEPSGALAEYYAIAIGKGKEAVTKFLEKNYKPNLSFDSALSLLVDTLKASFKDPATLDLDSVDFAVITKDAPFRLISISEVKKAISKK